MKPALSTRATLLISNRRLRKIVIVVVLIATIAGFVYYFHVNPQYFKSLTKVSPYVLVVVLGVNVLLLLTLVAIYDAILRLCSKQLAWRERFLLTSYSSIVNFFGPLQSGPGVRAVYLKTKHNVRIRDYTLGTLLYYGLFAAISAGFLLAASRPWWQLVLGLAIVSGLSILVIRRFRQRDRHVAQSQFRWQPNVIAWLGVVTLLQIVLVSLMYFIELRALDPHITYSQAATYTGAANFALFVSLTPGAIGFREAFLYFSQHLHHVPGAEIASANLIDRGIYVVFLALLFVIMLAMHAGRQLRTKPPRQQSDDSTDVPSSTNRQ